MSITDDVRATESRPDDGRGGEPRGNSQRTGGDGQFDRTPPQDVAAEQCVLGGMLLSKDAIADVVEVLRTADFYRPNHATVFDAVLDLYGRGEPADAITVAASLADAGDLARVGGAAYLHTLIASVPTAANAAYYAKIVSERAVLRRLIEAGTRIVQLGFGNVGGAGRDTDDLVDLAQQAVYDITERRVSEDFAVLAEMLQPTLDEIEAVGASGGLMSGVPTGFADLDRLLNGLHAGQLIIVAGRPGLGKALALDTPLPTPDGWTTMAEVQPGARLIGADGRPTTVVAASEIMHGRPCYEVEFSDGTVIVADGEHRWLTRARLTGLPGPTRVCTTAGIAADAAGTHAVTNTRPLELPARVLPVPAYTFGVCLGGGLHDPDLGPFLDADGVGSPSGVNGDGRIPAGYLRGSRAQRWALLAGLMDAAATVGPAGGVRYGPVPRRLADDVYDLVVGLGHRCTMTGPDAATTLDITAVDDLFRVERKRLAHKESVRATVGVPVDARLIVGVRRVPSVPVRCVQVDNDDHLYLAGRSMVPTHNSTAAMDFSRAAAVKNNMASAIFSLEMSKVEIVMRLLSAEARVPLHVLRSGQLSDDDWTKLARRMGEISEAPLFVDDTPNMNLMEIRAKARRLKQRHDLKLIVVDYLQLMSSPKRTESRQQEVAELSRGLKLLAKEVECPVVAVSQLNRGPEQRTDKRPQLADLRESGCMTADTTLLRADTGAPVTFAALLRDGFDGISVWSLDEDRRLVARPIVNVFPSGTKTVYRLSLASGRTVKASGNHRFATFGGWTALDALRPGDRVAVPSRIPPPIHAGLGWSEHQLRLLAHVLGGRHLPAGQSPGYPSSEAASVSFAAAAAAAAGCDAPRPDERRLPDALYSADDGEIRLFLRHRWAA
ncbi:MAG: replicative helicase, partial [Micromonosporaceae bacterium]|nr:replicative helicase [Micromonosporaceae bacterium]